MQSLSDMQTHSLSGADRLASMQTQSHADIQTQSLSDIQAGGSWGDAWALILLMYLRGNLARQETALETGWEEDPYREDCPYFERIQNGNAYEEICNHWERRGEGAWVMCDPRRCPRK